MKGERSLEVSLDRASYEVGEVGEGADAQRVVRLHQIAGAGAGAGVTVGWPQTGEIDVMEFVSRLPNVAIGGNFGGPIGDDVVFPQSLLVDYIRVFRAPDTAEQRAAAVPAVGTGWQQVTVPFRAFAPATDAQLALAIGEAAPRQIGAAAAGRLVPTDVQGYSLMLEGADAARRRGWGTGVR